MLQKWLRLWMLREVQVAALSQMHLQALLWVDEQDKEL